MKMYDYVFVTHLPAFYKVNLYNELAKSCSLLVIFIAPTSVIRTPDFTRAPCAFKFVFLNNKPFEQRNSLLSCLALIRILGSLRYRKLVLGGWDLLEFWFLAYLSAQAKNCLILESSIYDSSAASYRGWIKKIFLKRIHFVFASGKPHQALLQALHYHKASKTTLGVGLNQYPVLTANSTIPKQFSGKFLYIGRLAPEKNISLLLQVFAQLPHYTLTLIGQGPLAAEINQLKTDNVSVHGHIEHELLTQIYLDHDVFILPSSKEPWGLVVEEALYYGLPVICSSNVGCAEDLILANKAGALFSPSTPTALNQAIAWVVEHYAGLVQNIAALEYEARAQYQVNQYLEALL